MLVKEKARLELLRRLMSWEYWKNILYYITSYQKYRVVTLPSLVIMNRPSCNDWNLRYDWV